MDAPIAGMAITNPIIITDMGMDTLMAARPVVLMGTGAAEFFDDGGAGRHCR